MLVSENGSFRNREHTKFENDRLSCFVSVIEDNEKYDKLHAP